MNIDTATGIVRPFVRLLGSIDKVPLKSYRVLTVRVTVNINTVYRFRFRAFIVYSFRAANIIR